MWPMLRHIRICGKSGYFINWFDKRQTQSNRIFRNPENYVVGQERREVRKEVKVQIRAIRSRKRLDKGEKKSREEGSQGRYTSGPWSKKLCYVMKDIWTSRGIVKWINDEGPVMLAKEEFVEILQWPLLAWSKEGGESEEEDQFPLVIWILSNKITPQRR